MQKAYSHKLIVLLTVLFCSIQFGFTQSKIALSFEMGGSKIHFAPISSYYKTQHDSYTPSVCFGVNYEALISSSLSCIASVGINQVEGKSLITGGMSNYYWE